MSLCACVAFYFYRHGRKSRRRKRRLSRSWRCAKETRRTRTRSRCYQIREQKKRGSALNVTPPIAITSVQQYDLIAITSKSVTRMRPFDSNKKGPSITKWYRCKRSRTSWRLRLWNTWLGAKKRSKKNCALRSKPWSDSSSDSTWSDELTRKTKKEFKFRCRSPALKKRRQTGSANCRIQARCKLRPSAS